MKSFLNRVRSRIAVIFAAMLVGIGVLSPPIGAQTVSDTVTWSNPIAYTDGSPLASTDIANTKVFIGTAKGGPYNSAVTIAGPGTSAVIARTGTTSGIRCYVAVAVTKAGAESDTSDEACKTIDPPPKVPNKPTNVTVK